MEQEIIEEESPVENIFKRSLEVIQEQSMEINEEKDDHKELGKHKVIESILEVDHELPEPSSLLSSRKLFGRFDNDLMNLLHASIQEDKKSLYHDSGPIDIFSGSLVQSNYEKEIQLTNQRKESFRF